MAKKKQHHLQPKPIQQPSGFTLWWTTVLATAVGGLVTTAVLDLLQHLHVVWK